MTLPDADLPRKPHRRRWLFAPYLLLLLVAIVWTAGWVWLRVSTMRQIEVTAQTLRDQGYQVSWSAHRVAGYPFRLETKLTDVRIGEPSGWALEAPEFTAEAAVYALGRWTAVAPEGVRLIRPAGGGAVVIRGELLRASVSGFDKRPPNIIVEGRKLTFAREQGAAPYPFQTAERLDFNLRPGPNDQAALLFRVENARTELTGLLARVAQDRPISANWESILGHMSAFRGRNWPDAVRAWTAAGGAINVRNASITAGDAVAEGKTGDLTVGPDGRLRGELEVDLREAPLSGETAAAAAVSALAGGGAQATLNFDGGQTLIGPLSVGPAPRVY
ncbi:MAG: hypothetical protein BGN86_06865 [Caulobacterales bacterium 68-7]|nr:DUF2125 domain-containing protein [Caulobacterales bacterium]OJU10598.1 MAG: hypothetical protein BGN86_06865 [Caulobacterales bacterium 68-7]